MRCPKCGSDKVQLSVERNKHGCLWFILFGIWFFIIKWTIGLCVLMCWDWWMAIIKVVQHKGYVWKFKRWFSNTKKIYYCHECSYNFKG